MDFRSSHQSDNAKPKRLKTLVSNVEFPGRNTLLHQFVLDNSRPNEWGGENYIAAVLRSMSGFPGDVTNALNGDGYTALHIAVLKDNLLMVKKLLSCILHIDVNARSRRGNLDAATRYKCNDSTALHLAASLGNLPIIQELLDKGASIDIGDRNEMTALCISAKLGDLEVMKFLVSKGATVNRGCLFGTLVCCAVETGNVASVEFLVSSGADLNARCGGSFTSLHHAVLKADLEMVGFLIARGAELDPIYALNYFPFIKGLDNLDIFGGPFGAELLEHFDAMELVPDAELENFDVMDSVQGAELENLDVMDSVQGAELENFEIIPPLQCSVLDSKQQSASLHRDDDGVLQIAAFLIEKGAYMHAAVKDDKKLLPDVRRKSLKCAELLLRSGSELKASVTVDGWTPLHAAAYIGHAELIREFLDKGADVNARNNDGMTPLDLAREKGEQSCIDALQNVG